MDIETITKKSVPILRQYGVKKAALFGSAAYGEMKPGSDVDILVEMPKDYRLFDLLALHTDLEESLLCDVDLVEYDLLKDAYKPYILSTQKPISLW